MNYNVEIMKEHYKDARFLACIIFIPCVIALSIWFIFDVIVNKDVLDALIVGGCTIIASLIAVISGKHIYLAANIPVSENKNQNLRIVVARLMLINSRLNAGLPRISSLFDSKSKNTDLYEFYTSATSTFQAILRSVDLDTFNDEVVKTLPQDAINDITTICMALRECKFTVEFYNKDIIKQGQSIQDRPDLLKMNIDTIRSIYIMLDDINKKIHLFIVEWSVHSSEG